ncbi:MAG: HdeD family acid-resistance protein [Wujia sp.]
MNLTKFKSDMVFRSIAMIVAGVIIFAFPDSVQRIFAFGIAMVLVIMGAIKILRYAKNSKSQVGDLNEYESPSTLVTGILLVIFAILVPTVLGSFIPFVLGLIVLISGVLKLAQGIELKKANAGNATGILIMAAISIIVGLLAVCNPFKTVSVLLQIIGAGLIYGGITDLIATGYVSGKMK